MDGPVGAWAVWSEWSESGAVGGHGPPGAGSSLDQGFWPAYLKDGIALRVLASWLGAISIENRTLEEKRLAPRQSFLCLATSDVNH